MSDSLSTTPQDAVALLARLPRLETVGLSFTAVGMRDAGLPEAYDIKLTAGAQRDISEVAEATLKQLIDASLIAYGPVALIPRQHWMHVAEAEAATLTTVEAAVKKQDLLPFRAKRDDAGAVKMLAARFTTSEGIGVTFYRIADPLLQAKRSKVFGWLQESEVYGRLEPADVLLLRNDFEVVVIAGYAFFNKKATFERAFGFLDQLRSESGKTFTAVTQSLRIKGLAELQQACTSQLQMMAKMSSIKRSMDADPDYAKAMTMKNLIAYIESHPHVDIEIEGEGEGRSLVFDPSPARRFQILKLLDDDFLRSVLTQRDYEAGSKQRTGLSVV